jgi:hypothetical protein
MPARSRFGRGGRWLASGLLKATAGGDYVVAKRQHVWKPAGLGEALGEDDFEDLARVVLADGRTLLSWSRLLVLWQCVRNTRHMTGDACEVGVFKGGSAFFLAAAYARLKAAPARFHAIDTFEGHAPTTITVHDTHHRAGMFADTDHEDVRRYLSAFAFVTVHKGEFSGVASSLGSPWYRLVHVDTDLYRPTLDCLDYFSVRVQPGSTIIVDDYGGRKCPGVTRAVSEFLAANPGFAAWFFQTEQVVLVRQ